MKKILEHYVKTSEPDENQRRIIQRLRSRLDAHASILPETEHAGRGFLRIERVAKAEPVPLFGQNVPSFAHNRVVVCFGTEGDAGLTVSGAPLMSALISEESLAQLMLSPNRTNGHVALTAESWLGETMPLWQGVKTRPDDLLDAAMSETLQARRDAVDALKEMASEGKGAISKARQQDMKHLLDRVMSKGDAKFRLERHAENLQRILVQNRVEASTAALNLEGIARAARGEVSLLEGGSDITNPSLARDKNGMLNAAMERFTPQEAQVAYLATLSYMGSILDEKHPDITYTPSSEDPHGQNIRAILRGVDPYEVKELERLASLAGHLGNPYVNEKRELTDGQCLTASCSFISGGSEALHSSFPATDHGYFALRIETAYFENSFGNEKIRQGSTILELGLSPEDMMTALRGHPTGADIPCSIDHVAGIAVPRPKFPGDLEVIIKSDAVDPSVITARGELHQLVADASEMIAGGAKRVSDRQALGRMMEQIDLAMEEFSGVELRDVQSRADHMGALVNEMNRSALKSINDYVFDRHGCELPMINSSRDHPAGMDLIDRSKV